MPTWSPGLSLLVKIQGWGTVIPFFLLLILMRKKTPAEMHRREWWHSPALPPQNRQTVGNKSIGSLELNEEVPEVSF